VELVANLMSADVAPATWAADREAEGWDVLSVADHLFSDTRPFPHLWVTLGALAASTTTVKLTSAFANNLFRSPVEFAQASLGVHMVSGGRFEAGLGAGWSASEMVQTGRAFPDAGERAGRYIEAIKIVRTLFHERSCTFHGDWYDIDVTAVGPSAAPPLLVGSCGGPRTIREAVPLLDRVEIKGASLATRGGRLDLSVLGQIPRSHIADLVGAVRAVRPDIPIGAFVLCSAIDDARTRSVLAAMPPDSFFAGFFGPADKVAASIAGLADLGISRAQVSPFTDASFPLIAEAFTPYRSH
jgi:alkanesulfonate monooxygenase SsuD/methylene tetrahydromethanopterin reductase-like flavin-dependent oxidoreductase (luciferase family)